MTGLAGRGVLDWLVQRITAVILALYTLVLLGWILMQGDVTFAAWQALFATIWMRIFTLLALLATCAHGWIGVWTVGSDYLQSRSIGGAGDRLRFLYQVVCALILAGYLVWGLVILWGAAG